MSSPASIIDVLSHQRTPQDYAQQQGVMNQTAQQTQNMATANQGAQINNQADLLKLQQLQQSIKDQQNMTRLFADIGKAGIDAQRNGGSPQAQASGGSPVPGLVGVTANQLPTLAGSSPTNGTQQSSPLGPDIFSDPRKFGAALSAYGVSGAGVMNGVTGLIQQNLEAQKYDKEKLDMHLAHSKIAGDLLGGVVNLANADPTAAAKAYPDARQKMVEHAPELDKFLPPTAPGYVPKEQDFYPAAGLVGATGNLAQQHKTVAEIAEQQAQARKNAADAARTQVETDLLNTQNERFKQLISNPQGLQQVVANSIDPVKYPAEYKRALNEASNAKDYDSLMRAIDTHSARVGGTEGQIAVETNPQVLQAHRDSAAIQANLENALHQGDTGAAHFYDSLADTQSTLARTATIRQVVKLARAVKEGGQDSALAAQQLRTMLPEATAAIQDMKLRAAGNAPITSSLDELKNKMSSAFLGDPLTESTLKTINPYLDVIDAGALGQHQAKVEAIKKTYPQARLPKNTDAVSPSPSSKVDLNKFFK